MKKILFTIALIFLFALPVYATDYYINFDTGNDSTGDGSIGTPWKTVAKLNQTLTAGDTGYLRGNVGSYMTYDVGALDSSTEGIHPDNQGTSSGAKITYSVYPGEMVHLQGNHQYSRGVVLREVNYIHVTGYDGSTSALNLKVSNMYQFLIIDSSTTSYPYSNGSDYCEIDHVEFTTNVGTTVHYRGSTLYHNSQYNWIHDCTFSVHGAYTTSADGGALFELGYETTSGDNTAYNVIEDCKFFQGGHHTFGLHLKYNVIRNNHMHNEKWWLYATDGNYYSYRNFYVAGNSGKTHHGYNLIEGNRISHAGPNLNPGNCGGSGISLNQSNVIIRYNDFYANGLGGIFIQAGSGEECDGNHIYNNSWLSNGFLDNTQPSNQTACLSTINYLRRPICVWDYNTEASWLNYEGIVIKNNLMWKNQQGPEGSSQIVTDGDAWPPDIIVTNNWKDSDGDPKFTDEGSYSSPSMSDPDFSGCDQTSTTDPDLTLQSNSPCIDQGTYLTQANGSGSTSTTLIVDDAGFFQPGWGNGAGGGASVAADYIAITTVTNTVQISSIDYANKTITLASAKSWSDNANIWLYKDSDGTVVLKGTAPDIGAHESTGAGAASGTISPGGCPESDVVSGGRTIVIDLTNAVLVAAGATFDAQRQNILNGITAATSPANSWNAEWRDKEAVTAVVWTDSNTITVTMSSQAAIGGTFDIATEQIVTVTIATTVTEEAVEIVCTPTFVISTEQIGAESISGVYHSTGPGWAYDATGPSEVAP